MEIIGIPSSSNGAGKFVRWGARRKGRVGVMFSRYDSWRNRRQFKRNRTMGF